MHSNLIRTLALGGVLVLAACTPSTGNQTTGPAGTVAAAASGDASATISVLDFKLDPATISVTGTVLSLAVTNDGPTVHNVTIREGSGPELFGTADLKEGESETVVHAIAPGTYVLYCDLPGHESLGIIGSLTVTAP